MTQSNESSSRDSGHRPINEAQLAEWESRCWVNPPLPLENDLASAVREIRRLRAALKRVTHQTSIEFARDIAREALEAK